MAFTDLSFLFVFLPVVWFCYRLAARTKFANLYILIASLIFYAWGGLTSLAVLVLILLWNYMSAKLISSQEDESKRRQILYLAVGVDLFVLFFYRYLGVWFGFALPSLSRLPGLMPAGLSFYLFSCLSCIFDVYREKAPAPDSLIDFGVYAAFFGRVNMGPIANYSTFRPQLAEHKLSRQKTQAGMLLFLQGLFRKVILADNFALLYSALAGNTSWIGNLLFGFAYFFQLYFDFSGYSRMARGTASLFGFTIDPNFDLPYTADSVQDFWRRWHISLTSWFREYIYIPLGGNRVSHSRWLMNILCVWVLTGLWHGATLPFLFWGLYQGCLILLEHAGNRQWLKRMPGWLRHVYLIITQLIGWTFFSNSSLISGLSQIGRYFLIGITSFADSAALFALLNSLVLLIVAIIVASGFSKTLALLLKAKTGSSYGKFATAGWVVIFAICVSFIVSASAQTFLYAVF